MRSRSACPSVAWPRWPPLGAPSCAGTPPRKALPRLLNSPAAAHFGVEFVFGATSPVAFSPTHLAGTAGRFVSVPQDLPGSRRMRPRPLGADVAYTAEQIQVLEGLEPVRRRPGMYIGSTDQRGLHHLVWELVDNSGDRALAGYRSEIIVSIHAERSVSGPDTRPGIP